MRKIKLLHISRPTEFGLYRFLIDLIKYTDKNKFDIAIAAPRQGPLLEDLKNEGIRVIPLEMTREINPLADIKSFFSILRLLRKEKWDIVHLHCSKAGFLGRIAARLVGVPAIIYTPNSWYFDEPLPCIKKKFYIFLEKLAAYFGDRIVTVTKEEERDIIEKKISSPNKIVTIYDAIDINILEDKEDSTVIRNKYKIPKDDMVVGMIARLVPQKDPCTFVKLAYEVTKETPNVTFVLIGDGPLRRDVENLKSRLKIGNKLVITGECDIRKEINGFLNLIDISVLTSLYEGLPLVALQSMYLKKPVIITEVRGIDEVIENNKNGFIVPMDGINSMKNIILELLRDEGRTRQIGLAARTTVEEHFTADKMAHAYERLYLTLLK